MVAITSGASATQATAVLARHANDVPKSAWAAVAPRRRAPRGARARAPPGPTEDRPRPRSRFGRSWRRRLLPARSPLEVLDDVGDEDALAVDAGGSTASSRIRPAGPTNGAPGESSVIAGLLADEHQRRGTGPSPKTVWVPDAHRSQARHPAATFATVGRPSRPLRTLSRTSTGRGSIADGGWRICHLHIVRGIPLRPERPCLTAFQSGAGPAASEFGRMAQIAAASCSATPTGCAWRFGSRGRRWPRPQRRHRPTGSPTAGLPARRATSPKTGMR